MNLLSVNDFLKSCSEQIERKLNQYYQQYHDADLLLEVIRYSSTDGGKRIRPALIYATAEIIGLPAAAADDIACAVELIHSYSLIHDDLPAMDDDDFRRGKPATHKTFGEALAILAGDAMHATAFELLASSAHLNQAQKVTAIGILASASGINGMSHGQTLDIVLSDQECDIGMVEKMHRLKTGSLMQACILIPIKCHTPLPQKQQKALQYYSDNIGLCFQICDDILDMGTDKQMAHGAHQPTYPALLGLDGAKNALIKTRNLCLAQLAVFGEQAEQLQSLTRYIADRNS